MDFERSRLVWYNHIARWGGGYNKGLITRGTTSRPATVAMSSYTPRERASIAIDNVVRLVVSAYQVAEANYIDFEQDIITFKGKRYRIVTAPQGQQPDGTWIAWDCTCVLTD